MNQTIAPLKGASLCRFGKLVVYLQIGLKCVIKRKLMKNRLFICIFSLAMLCAAPAFAQVETTRLTSVKPINNHSYIGLKTNLLYDALMVPNLGAEFNLYNNYSVYADVMYAHWNRPQNHFYWNLYGAQFGARKYFGQQAADRSMSGHHAGVYGQMLAYDLQAGNIGQQTPNINMGFGAEYGYSFPLTLNLNVDIEVGIGMLTGRYYEYVVEEGHYTWRGTIQRAWIGPTKASVSLVWLIKSYKRGDNISISKADARRISILGHNAVDKVKAEGSKLFNFKRAKDSSASKKKDKE